MSSAQSLNKTERQVMDLLEKFNEVHEKANNERATASYGSAWVSLNVQTGKCEVVSLTGQDIPDTLTFVMDIKFAFNKAMEERLKILEKMMFGEGVSN